MSDLLRNIACSTWRRIPGEFRRKTIHSVLERIAPRLDDVSSREIAGKDIPRIVVGFLSSPSGLGQSARLIAAALKQGGHAVYGIDLGRYFFEVADLVEHGLPDGRAIMGRAHLIININAPYLPYVLWLLGRRFLRGKHVTGYWAWELPSLPETWRRGLACVHDIAVPSSFVAEAVLRMDAGRRVHVLPHPVAGDAPVPDEGVQQAGNNRPFTVGFIANIASGFERKNPLAVIAAFRRAFDNDPGCRLKLLLSNAEHHPPARSLIEKAVNGAGNIDITWQNLGRAAMRQWWHDVDVYASLHRSEGFGLTMAEAMCAGKPVVATGWSGNMDFMNEKNSFPVRHELVEVQDAQGKYASGLGRWAEPDIDHAAELLQELRENPDLRRATGARARETVSEYLSREHFLSLFSKMQEA